MVDIIESVMPLLTSTIFWFSIVIVMIILGFAILLFMKHRKYVFPCFELLQLGTGKVVVNQTKCGWFKNKTMLFGLIDYGSHEVMKLKDGRKVFNFTTEDYHETGKRKRCLVVTSDQEDRRFVVPLGKFTLKNQEIFAELPPIEIQDACIDAFKQAEKEMKTIGEAIIQLAIIGFIVVGSLIAIVMVTRFAQNMVAEASKIAVQNSQICAEVCSDAVVSGVERILSQPSGVAP